MNCKQVSKIVSNYLIDDVDDDMRSAIEGHLSECADCNREVESLQNIWMKLGNLPEAEPSASVRARFDAGVAMALLVIGLFVGRQMQPETRLADVSQLRSEVQELRQMVATSLLQNQSSSERLRGVSYSYQIERPDDETLTVLLNTLNYDPNVNVRLAAIDALSNFYDEPEVRRGVIESLSRQSSPLVQIALIDLLVRTRETNSIETLKHMQQNETFNPTVREQAGRAIERIR